MLVINVASAAGCMVYISWLSWQVLALVILLTLIASVSCRWFLVSGWRWLGVAREQQDRLFQHFRTLVDGVKELKLHYFGQQDFLEADLEQTAIRVQRRQRARHESVCHHRQLGKVYLLLRGRADLVCPTSLDWHHPRNALWLRAYLYLCARANGEPGQQATAAQPRQHRSR